MMKSFFAIFILIVSVQAIAEEALTLPKLVEAPSTDHPLPPKRAFDVSGYEHLLDTRYSLFPHKGTYILPITYNATPDNDLYKNWMSQVDPNNLEDFYEKTEAEFQISFMIPIYRKIAKTDWDLLFAYTHHAWWQIYNDAWSKPFRETNYMPELFFRNLQKNPDSFLGTDLVAWDIGYMHQSNGQVQELSRSWDRVFVRGYFLADELAAVLTLWARLPEGASDDNADIYTFMGIGELEVAKTFGKNSLRVKVPLAQTPSIDLQYSYPWRDHLRWMFSLRSGYGHSLIEYDRQSERVGFGLVLESFLDQPATQD
jgi:phospholipase A1